MNVLLCKIFVTVFIEWMIVIFVRKLALSSSIMEYIIGYWKLRVLYTYLPPPMLQIFENLAKNTDRGRESASDRERERNWKKAAALNYTFALILFHATSRKTAVSLILTKKKEKKHSIYTYRVSKLAVSTYCLPSKINGAHTLFE